MSTRACSASQSPSRLKRAAIPSRPARRVSPRRRGPRLGSRLRGRTRKRKSACAGQRVPVRPNNRPYVPKDRGGVQPPPPPPAGELIGCPTRPEKRTVTRCPRPPPSPRHRPHTPTPPPRRKCFTASTLPILPCCSINAKRQQSATLPTACSPNQPPPRAQRKRAPGPSPPRPSPTPAVSDYSAAAVPFAGRMSRRSAIRAALPVRPRR
ncbi:hypothetical protein C8J47_0889 [Sphingomonas sp. PP-F2F-G114-C0414]|nr:hypothetical protein C8J47_0889 [Sphingomonas sp. PP-F2F-G114-C0414]